MTTFSFNELFIPTITIFAITLILSFSVTKSAGFSIAAAWIKSGIYFIYFYYYFDGTFTMNDDHSYLKGGKLLIENDITLLNLHKNWQYIFMIGQGKHFIYYLINAYSFRLFGYGYFAPVALNVVITIFIGVFGSTLAKKEFRLSASDKKLFYLCLIFHPEILSWSTLINIKDIIVLFNHILYLYSFSLFLRKKYFPALLLMSITTVSMFFLRYYTPIIFFAAFMFSQINFMKIKITYIIFISIFISSLIAWLGIATFVTAYNQIIGSFSNPITGFVRTLFTPIPFHTEKAYSFLNVPMVIHWLSLPAMIQGVLEINKIKTDFKRFFYWYVALFFLLYSIFAELQGPRHRLQLDFGIALIQFCGLKALIQICFNKTIVWSANSKHSTQVSSLS